MPEFLYRIQPTRLAMLTDGPTAAEGAAVAAHRAYLDRMAAAGVVLFFGRTLTTDAATFGIVVFRAESPEAAGRIMADDPAVRAARLGLLASVSELAAGLIDWSALDV